MPTEAEITAARVALLDTPFNASTRDLAVAALTASEEVRGQVSEEDARAECARLGIDPDDNCADGGIDAWMVVRREMIDKALARRGAGQAVPDEAAIRADERERCKRHAQKLSSSEVMINGDMARRAPKPEDKP